MIKAIQIKSGKVVYISEQYLEDNKDTYKAFKKPVVKRKKAEVKTEDA